LRKVHRFFYMPDNTSDRPRIFLDKVHLKGYKSIEDLSIDIQKGLNILIGKNGSGKSNFMEFLFHAIDYVRNNNLPYKYAKLELVSDDEHSFIVELEKEIQTKLVKKDFDGIVKVSEKISIDNNIVFNNAIDEDFTLSFEFNNSVMRYWGTLKNLFLNLGYQYVFPLYIKYDLPNDLACISAPGSLKINLEEEFGIWEKTQTLSFIMDIFWRLESIYDESIAIKEMVKTDFYNQLQLQLQKSIVENLKLYSPIEDIRFNNNVNVYNAEKKLIIENIKLDFKVNGNWLPWSQLSDGTKRLFYIIAEVTSGYGLILIEEPELGIHPHQFHLLMNFLKEQSENKQIIISTHAPKALDHLTQNELNNIILTCYDPKKGTQMRHLTANEVKKAKLYLKEFGFFSDYWLMSDLEE